MNFNITLLPGDGIGPEVVGEAVRVLDVIASKYNHTFNFQERLMGGCSIDKYGQSSRMKRLPIAKRQMRFCLAQWADRNGMTPTPKIAPSADCLRCARDLACLRIFALSKCILR